jgi:quercetin dioxygenase-like cupin family protein
MKKEIAASPGSRIMRFHAATHRWEGVQPAEYRKPGEDVARVVRMALAGESGEKMGFEVHYLEIAPGGSTALERHQHEHVVVVLRGHGRVRLGTEVHAIGCGDSLYVAPAEVHQFENDADEPFGFLCVVDAVRDVGVPVIDPAAQSRT